jgi:toxin ParE1/3/4
VTATLKPVSRHPEARVEAWDAAAHYDSVSDTAAARFLLELEQTVRKIQLNPGLYPRTLAGAKQAILSVFPYSVIYRETSREIQILAIAHGRRRPGYWRSRTF